MEEDIKILEDLKNKWELNAFGDMVNVLSLDEIKAIENLLKRYKELEEENKRLNNHNLIGRIDAIKIEDLESVLKPYYIPISVIQNKIDEINRRIDYLNTELSKCYIEREKLGTETDIDNNETAIFCMEQEREYRYEQKRALQELLNERNK